MKLVLQIAAGVVLAYLVIRALELAAVGFALHGIAEALPTLRTHPRVEFPKVESPPAPALREQASGKRWTVTTPDGRTYSGTGTPPPSGLKGLTPDAEPTAKPR